MQDHQPTNCQGTAYRRAVGIPEVRKRISEHGNATSPNLKTHQKQLGNLTTEDL